MLVFIGMLGSIFYRNARLKRFGLLTAMAADWADNRKSACGAAAGQTLTAIQLVKRRCGWRKQCMERNARRPKAFAAIVGENGKASRRRLDLEHAHAEAGVRAHVGESCQSHEARKQPHLGFVGVFAGANP